MTNEKEMAEDWRDELNKLRSEHHLNSLGDRPHSMAAEKLARMIELETYEARLRRAQRIDPSTNGVMVDNSSCWVGHRDFHPTTDLQDDEGDCVKHCPHDLSYMRGDPVHVTERQIWCVYEDEDGFCGHVCRKAPTL